MPMFKGFEKDDAGNELAVVDFPEARKFSYDIINGAIAKVETPNPHEERLSEEDFRAKFKAGFEVLPKTYPDSGFNLDALAAAAEAKAMPQGPAPRMPGQNNNI